MKAQSEQGVCSMSKSILVTWKASCTYTTWTVTHNDTAVLSQRLYGSVGHCDTCFWFVLFEKDKQYRVRERSLERMVSWNKNVFHYTTYHNIGSNDNIEILVIIL